MPDPASIRDLIKRHESRLYLYLRSLLPATSEADTAFVEATARLLDRGRGIRPSEFADLVDRVAREAVADRRKASAKPTFSDDLVRQLAESAKPSLDGMDKRSAALDDLLKQLPPPERDLLRRKYELRMTPEQIALAENRTVAAVVRDSVALHGSLVSRLREAVPDGGPEPGGGAEDLGRLTNQLLDGTITDDGRLVLETLLLADPVAQAHYHRHVALVSELNMRFRGLPPVVEPPPATVPRVTRRERIVTGVFVIACVGVLVFLVLLFTGQLN